MEKNIYTINAEGRTLGRVASEAAKVLMGKNTTSYTPNKVTKVSVVINNASKTKMTEVRKNNTLHERYSGYPGGFRQSSNRDILAKKGWKELYKLSVYGMLPSNKLRPIMMKNLTINE